MIVIGVYSILIILFCIGLLRLPKTNIDTNIPFQKFSLIIPFRNEETNLESLLQSIKQLHYKKENLEVLFIDDASTDNSVNIVKKWQKQLPNIQLHSNYRVSSSPKKDAIQVGVKRATFDFIITTDADCILPKELLNCYNSDIQRYNSLCIAGPIKYTGPSNFLTNYQKLDSLSLLGTTMGCFGLRKPTMCNAANLGFSKKEYLEMESQNHHITSGDDIFTLEYFIKKHPSKISFLNTPLAVVTTKTEESWSAVIMQRVRWAAKTKHYQNTFTKLLGLVVFATQLTLLFYLFFNLKTALFLWLVKATFDFILLISTALKTKQHLNFVYYPFIAILYPFLNTYIAILSLFGGFTWKGRKFKR